MIHVHHMNYLLQCRTHAWREFVGTLTPYQYQIFRETQWDRQPWLPESILANIKYQHWLTADKAVQQLQRKLQRRGYEI